LIRPELSVPSTESVFRVWRGVSSLSAISNEISANYEKHKILRLFK
jgi:hypothetical protein